MVPLLDLCECTHFGYIGLIKGGHHCPITSFRIVLRYKRHSGTSAERCVSADKLCDHHIPVQLAPQGVADSAH